MGVQKPDADGYKLHVMLAKDEKPICRAQCINPPGKMPYRWNLQNLVATTSLSFLDDLSHFLLCPAPECSRDQKEWVRFLTFLHTNNMVAIAKVELWVFYILPPKEASSSSHVRVAYQSGKMDSTSNGQRHCESGDSFGARPLATKTYNKVGDHLVCKSKIENCSRSKPKAVKQEEPLEKNYVRADPSYLQTLGQAHSGWIFGAIAELVDNSRDAKATKLEISVEIIYFKQAGKDIPMLSVIDDGHGMTHQEVVRMTCFGHRQPNADDPDRVGRFGVGFKTGAMRLGRDALVLTQTSGTRSIAFLSQSLNEGKDNLEIPVVSYYRKGQFMELDTNVQSEASAKYNLKAIKEFSPFNKYLIGEKAGLFCGKCTGTQIYIWNLDEWGSDYCLEWHNGIDGGSSFYQGDICIRSRRIRSRPGQISKKVPLDYSLRSYLEVIFLVPRMRIYVQGSPVRSRPLAKSLSKTCVQTGNIMGKPVQLTLGRCQLEWEQMNCGIFLYWHGRLIEAYKRVGSMIHNGDVGRGVIGVIDVTNLMDDGNGSVWVHNNKQGFQDCEPYVRLEDWLGKVVDEYWDNNFDSLQLNKVGVLCKPDQEWVQCDKCRKWRMLTSGFKSQSLPLEWFCYMEPFKGLCETPEQKVEKGVVTVSAKRSGYDRENPLEIREECSANGEVDSSSNEDLSWSQNEKDVSHPRPLKRIRKGLPRACKKV